MLMSPFHLAVTSLCSSTRAGGEEKHHCDRKHHFILTKWLKNLAKKTRSS